MCSGPSWLGGWLVEMASERGDGVQIDADGGGRVVTDLEILQASVVEVGSQRKTPFLVTTPPTRNLGEKSASYTTASKAHHDLPEALFNAPYRDS
jgi:hypothetical protein